MSADCRIPGSDEYRLDELDVLIASAQVKLNILVLRERATRAALEKLEQERKDLCQHPTMKEESSYYAGSYYDRAYTNYWSVCTHCGAKSKFMTQTHSYYG